MTANVERITLTILFRPTLGVDGQQLLDTLLPVLVDEVLQSDQRLVPQLRRTLEFETVAGAKLSVVGLPGRVDLSLVADPQPPVLDAAAQALPRFHMGVMDADASTEAWRKLESLVAPVFRALNQPEKILRVAISGNFIVSDDGDQHVMAAIQQRLPLTQECIGALQDFQFRHNLQIESLRDTRIRINRLYSYLVQKMGMTFEHEGSPAPVEIVSTLLKLVGDVNTFPIEEGMERFDLPVIVAELISLLKDETEGRGENASASA